MKKIFAEFGRTITVAIAVIALVGLTALFTKPDGAITRSFGSLVVSFSDKVNDTIDLNDGNTGLVQPSPSALIPEGVVYKTGYIYDPVAKQFDSTNEVVLHAGDYFPDTIQDGDFYIYNNYEYRYNAYADTTDDHWSHLNDWWYYETISEGWGMHYIGTDTNRPNDPLTSVLGKNITAATAAYFLHTEIEYAPAIPDTVENMSYAFSRCENLKEAPRMPSALTEMAFGFFDCFVLEQPPVLTNCTKLKNVESAFWDCYALKSLPVLPDSVNSARSLFSDCYSIVDASDFIIPANVTNAYNMFAYCEKLKYAPRIPETITEGIMRTFRCCEQLEGTVIIDANILDDTMQYEKAFQDVDMSKITLAGKCDAAMKQKIANTGKNGAQVTIINE